MPDPTQHSNATEHADSVGANDPTLARPVGAPDPLARAKGPPFAPPEHTGELGTFGRYRVLQQLGQGGMGAVFLAYDSTLERKVALKVMLGHCAADPDARARFLREARAVARVKSDHVVTIFDVGEHGGVPFIAMEYLLGSPLDKYLKQKGEVPLAQVLRICEETAHGLAAAHDLGLVHRDIKPGNLWLEAPNGRVKVLDFGLARIETEDTHLTGTGAVMGTPAYMSPEQGRAKKVDHRSDLFTLGVLLYRLCTGRLPFAGDTTMAILTALAVDDPVAPRVLRPDLPPALEAVILKLLQKNPADRYQSAAEVAAALRAVSGGPMPVVVAVPVQPFAVAAQTQNVWESIDDDSRSVAVPLATPAAIEVEPPSVSRPARRKASRAVSKTPVYLAAAGLLAACAVLAVVLWPKKKPVEEAKEPEKPPATVKKDPPKLPPVVPATGDRKIAEYVLLKGGGVFYSAPNLYGHAGKVSQLPAGPFDVVGVELFGKQWTSDDTAPLLDLKALTKLKIHDTSVGESGLKVFEGLTRLTELHIELSPVTDVGVGFLAGSRNLEVLSLMGTGITNHGISHFAGCKNLKHISLGDTNVDDDGLKPLADNPNLLGLTVGGSKVTGLTLERFSANPKLQQVSASALKLADADLVHLKKWSELWHLVLSVNDVGDAGLAHLTGLPLSYLDLRGTKVSDAGLVHLEKLSKLTDLYLSGKDVTVTEKRVKELAAKLPACRIEWNGGTIAPTARDPRVAARWLLDNKKLAKIGLVVNGEYRLTNVLPNEPFRVTRLNFSLFNNAGALLPEDVPALAAFTDLEELELACAATDEQFAPLVALKRMKALTVRNSSLTAKSAAVIRAMPELEHLYGPSTAEWVEALAGIKSLRQLTFYRQELTDRAAAALAGLPNFAVLTLSDCPLSDAAWGSVKALKGLRSLSVASEKPERIKELIAARPECEVRTTDAKDLWVLTNKGAQRRFAEFVIGLGGSVQCAGYAPERMTKLEHLPGEYADLSFIDLHGLSRELTDADVPTFELLKGADRLRGFVSSNAGLRSAHLMPLAPATELKVLTLSGIGVTDGAAANLRAAKGLQSLTLSRGPVGDTGLAHLKGCTALAFLSLESTATTDPGLANFRDLPALTDVVVSGTKIGDLGLAHLATCLKLRRIEANNTGVTDDGLKALHGLPLVSLAIKGTKVTEKGVKELAVKLPNCKIEWDGIVVPNPGATDREAAIALTAAGARVKVEVNGKLVEYTAPAEVPRDQPLKLVWVTAPAGAKIDARDQWLAPCAGCAHLQYVHLGGTPVTDGALAHFKTAKFLTSLELPGTALTDEGLRHLAGHEYLINVNLNGTKITDAGLAHLTSPRLMALALNNTGVTGAGLARFKDRPELRSLFLSGTGITDDTLAHIAGLSKLTRLDLTGTKVTEKGVKALAAKLPGCKIEWAGGTVGPKPAAPTDRAAAEALLALGGQVRSTAMSAKETIADPKLLPPGPFVLGYVLIETKDQPREQLDAALAACAACKELHTVVLYGPLVTNEMVARFKDSPKLNRLTIHRTPVTGAGLTPFKAHAALRVVSLEKADIGDEVLDALGANPELTFLDVRGTKVTGPKVAEFAKAAPKCRVQWPGGTIEPTQK